MKRWLRGNYGFEYFYAGKVNLASVGWDGVSGGGYKARISNPIPHGEKLFKERANAFAWVESQTLADAQKLVELLTVAPVT